MIKIIDSAKAEKLLFLGHISGFATEEKGARKKLKSQAEKLMATHVVVEFQADHMPGPRGQAGITLLGLAYREAA